MATAPLARVSRTAAEATRAREEFEAAVVAAHETGASLRAIASAAGTNYEAVRTIIRRGKAGR